MVNSLTCKLDDQSPLPLSPAPSPVPPPPPAKKTNFGDPSGPLFSLYSEIADEEDEEMADRWQQDAKDILIFVSSHVAILTAT